MENTTIKFETEPIDNATLLKLLGRPTTLADIDELIAVQDGKEEHFIRVVYCKDCKHRPYLDKDGFIEPENSICPCINEDDKYYSWMPEDDWFCADGERREDGR